MAKLFPPIVNNSTIVFYNNQNGMVDITIPFSMNKVVSSISVTDMTIKIKTLQSSSYFYTFNKDIDEISYSLSGDNSYLVLSIKD